MPHKLNAARRDKFPAAKYRVTNWREYNEALRSRGDLTIWFSVDAAAKWSASRRQDRGGQATYSDFAIEACLTLRLVFHQPLRQVQGMVRSLMRLMEIDLPVPDFSTLSRRGKHLVIKKSNPKPNGPTTLIVDSTGLKIHRGSDWCEKKHGSGKSRKSWRKLHIGLDPNSGDIVASLLTTDEVGDETALPDLITEIDVKVSRFLADGAYDGSGVFNTLKAAFGPDVEVIIPPPKSAATGLYDQRDAHIESIAELGRMGWQKATAYNDRALVEAQIGRWKTVIGDALKSRKIDTQVTEVQIGTKALNRMTSLGRAAFEPV